MSLMVMLTLMCVYVLVLCVIGVIHELICMGVWWLQLCCCLIYCGVYAGWCVCVVCDFMCGVICRACGRQI